MNPAISVDQIYIKNALAVVQRILSIKIFESVKNSTGKVASKLSGDLRAQEYYWASLKKLAFTIHNKNEILKTPKIFGNVGAIENSFNSMVLMSRACLDSLACTVNLVYGDKLKETNVRPLEIEFLKTIHHKIIKEIFLEKRNKWLAINEYRDLIIHRSAVMPLLKGPNPEVPFKSIGVVKDPHTFFLNISNPKKLEQLVIDMEKKINEIENLTLDTFIKISEAFD